VVNVLQIGSLGGLYLYGATHSWNPVGGHVTVFKIDADADNSKIDAWAEIYVSNL
jgi:hypothetical protein